MKKLLWFLLLLMVLPVGAQENPARLLFARGDLDATIAIHVLNADTGEERLMTELARAENSPTGHDVGWSPDGRVWVALVDEEGNRSLSFYDAESGEETPFGESFDPRTCASAIEWSPDGRYMSFPTATDNNAEGLTIYDTRNETHYTLPWIGDRFPDWSPDGNYMLLIDNYFTLDTGVGDAKTRLLRTEDGGELMRRGSDANAWKFAFSPDSRFFAYEENNTGWIYELATGKNSDLEVRADSLRWSPTGRYLLIGARLENVSYAPPQFSYDTQTGQLRPFDLDKLSVFAAWAGDESTVLLRSDFQTFGDSLLPQSWIAYDLATAKVETLIEAAENRWIGDVSRNGGWTVTIRYRPSEAKEGQWLSDIAFINGETVLESEINLGHVTPSFDTGLLSWSPDGRWLAVNTEDGLFRFDTETGSFARLSPDSELAAGVFWSPDSRYLAFQSGEAFTLWNVETDSIESLPEGISALIGWQDGDQQASLVCLHGYRDGDA